MVGGGIRCREYGNAMSVKGWGYESGMKLLTLIVQSRYARRREKERRRVCMDRKRASRDPRIQNPKKEREGVWEQLSRRQSSKEVDVRLICCE